MEESRDIAGTEFDWFAADRDGRFAVLATAGSGPVPEAVLARTNAHDAVGDGVEVVGWGTNEVWQGFSRVGLYAYDWSDRERRYVRVAEPAASLSPKLAADIAAIAGLPRLDVSFSAAGTIDPAWLTGAPLPKP